MCFSFIAVEILITFHIWTQILGLHIQTLTDLIALIWSLMSKLWIPNLTLKACPNLFWPLDSWALVLQTWYFSAYPVQTHAIHPHRTDHRGLRFHLKVSWTLPGIRNRVSRHPRRAPGFLHYRIQIKKLDSKALGSVLVGFQGAPMPGFPKHVTCCSCCWFRTSVRFPSPAAKNRSKTPHFACVKNWGPFLLK